MKSQHLEKSMYYVMYRVFSYWICVVSKIMYIFGKERDGKEFLQCNYVISEITLKIFSNLSF